MASLATTDRPAQQASVQKSSTPSSSSGRRDKEEQRQSRNKAAQFFREAETTRRQIEKLEKERTFMVLCRRNGWADVTEALEDYEKGLDDDRHSEKFLLRKQLMKIKEEVRRFQGQLIGVNDNPELLDHLKESMTEAETSIHGLKETQCSCFEELLKEEWTCGQEVLAYEKKIENWSLAAHSDIKQLSSAIFKETKSLDRDRPAGVKALESFLRKTGGTCGGWEKFDHETFIKVWRRHSGQPAYRKEAKLHLPSKTLKEIEDHEAWYQELEQLQDQKREAIQLWKANRERLSKMQNHEEMKKREKETKSNTHKVTEERKLTPQRLKERKEAKENKEEKMEEQRDAERTDQWGKEERRRQLEVKLMIEEQNRMKREKEVDLIGGEEKDGK